MANAGLVLTSGGLTNVSAIYLNALGSLTLVASATPVDFLPDSTPIYFNGGTLFFANNNQQVQTVGVNYAETVGVMNLVRGDSEVMTNQAVGAAQTSTLTFASINRSTGATVNFAGQALGANAQNEIVITGSLTSTGTATPWAFYSAPTLTSGVNGSGYAPGWKDAPTDFAVLSSTGSFGSVSARSGAVVTTSAAMIGDDYSVGGNISFTGNGRANTIRSTASGIFTVGTGNTLSVNGLMAAGTAFTIGATVGDGTLTSTGTAGGEIIAVSSLGSMTINSNIKDNGGAVSLVKSGNNNLTLSGTTNTFSGGLVVNGDGGVVVGNAASLGTGTITMNSGAIHLTALAASSTITNDWKINSDAVIWNNSSTTGLALTGSIVLNGNSTLYWTTTYTPNVQITGPISGTGNLNVQGISTSGFSPNVTLGGSSANTYTGLTSITGRGDSFGSTSVSLEKTSGNAISGDILLGQSMASGNYLQANSAFVTQAQEILGLAASSSGTTVVTNQDQIADTSIITFQGGNGYDAGVFQMNNQSETIGGVQSASAGDGLIQNNAKASGVSMLTLQTAASKSYTFSGLVQDYDNSNTGKSYVGQLAITKTGSGTQTFTGANTYSGGTSVNAGAFFANNTSGSATGTGALTVGGSGPATFGGTGTVNSGTDINFNSGSTILVGQANLTDTNTTKALALTSTTIENFSGANLVFNLSTITAGPTGQSNEVTTGLTTAVNFIGANSNTFSFNVQGAGTIANGTKFALFSSATYGYGIGIGFNQSAFGGDISVSGANNQISGINLNFINAPTTYTGSYLMLVDTSGGSGSSFDIDLVIAAAVPEPGTWAMMLGGLAVLLVYYRSRRKNT